MSLLRTSVAVLNAGLKAAGGEEVTYRRGAKAIDRLVVVWVNTRHDDFGGQKIALTARLRDAIVWAADLVCEGERWTPQRGDAIDWVDGSGVKRTFEVLPREDNEGRCYRHTDASEQQLRLYTVEKPPSTET